jgi:hypothetical protein
VGGEAPVTPVLSLDSSYLNPSYKPCDNRILTYEKSTSPLFLFFILIYNFLIFPISCFIGSLLLQKPPQVPEMCFRVSKMDPGMKHPWNMDETFHIFKMPYQPFQCLFSRCIRSFGH